MLLWNWQWSEEKELTTLGTAPQWVGVAFVFFKEIVDPCEDLGNLIQQKKLLLLADEVSSNKVVCSSLIKGFELDRVCNISLPHLHLPILKNAWEASLLVGDKKKRPPSLFETTECVS